MGNYMYILLRRYTILTSLMLCISPMMEILEIDVNIPININNSISITNRPDLTGTISYRYTDGQHPKLIIPHNGITRSGQRPIDIFHYNDAVEYICNQYRLPPHNNGSVIVIQDSCMKSYMIPSLSHYRHDFIQQIAIDLMEVIAINGLIIYGSIITTRIRDDSTLPRLLICEQNNSRPDFQIRLFEVQIPTDTYRKIFSVASQRYLKIDHHNTCRYTK